MTQKQVVLEDQSGDHKYFTITPQLVHMLCTTPQELSLWNAVKIIAGDSGECWLSERDLAEFAMQDKKTVANSRNTLIEIGLLEGEKRRHEFPDGRITDNEVWHIRVPDLWEANLGFRQKISGDSLKTRIAIKRALDEERKKANREKRPPTRMTVGHVLNFIHDKRDLIPKKVLEIMTEGVGDYSPTLKNQEGGGITGNKEEPVEEDLKKEEPLKLEPSEVDVTDSDKSSSGLSLDEEQNGGEFQADPTRENVTYANLDWQGDEVPTRWTKYHPLWVAVSQNLLGTPKNLQGAERTLWLELQKRAAIEERFGDWLLWQAQNNCQDRTFNFFYRAVINETHFDMWKAGKFVVKDQYQGVTKGGSKDNRQLDDKTARLLKGDFDLNSL